MNRQKSQNSDLLARISKDKGYVHEPLPSSRELDRLYIEGLIDELDDIPLDIGMYKRILGNPGTRQDNRVLLQNLIELDTQRYWRLELEIEEARKGYDREEASF